MSDSPIFAWDLSDYDYDRGTRPSHVAAAAGEGIRIVTHKATEHSTGGVFKHEHMGEMLTAARDAGVPFIGPYVVVRSGIDPAVQAATAIAFIREQTPWWFTFAGRMIQVDLEKWPYDNVAASIGEAVAVELERQAGVPVRALMYASRGQYADSLPGTRPLWNANYNYSGASRPFRQQWADVEAHGAPGFVTYSGRMPIMVQFASDAVIGGGSPGDISVFRGTEAEFAAIIGATPPAPPPPPAPKPVLRRTFPGYARGQYFGLRSGPAASHGGINAAERADVKAIQQRLIALGFVPGISNPASGWADGVFEQPTKDAVARWQRARYAAQTSRYGEVWADDWARLFTY